MRSTTAIFALNCTVLIISITLLCLSTSIFDFIVSNKMYYTVPDQRILIDSEHSYWFYATSSLCALLSLAMIMYNNAPSTAQNVALQYPFGISLVHGALLSVSCVACSFCCLLSVQTGNEVGRFAFQASPQQFQLASHWYFVRLRATALLFGVEAVLSMAVLCILYLGIECKYRTFAELPRENKEYTMKTTLFA